MTIFLDSAPLSLLTHPRRTEAVIECHQWMDRLLQNGCSFVIPEIIDYELRREFLRMNRVKSIHRLDYLGLKLNYLPITTEAMKHAAALWAQARAQGQPTAPDNTMDVDIILASQLITARMQDSIVATTNVGHLERFVNAAAWHTISSNSA